MTRPPLRLVLDADKTMPRRLSQQGLAEFSIGAARMYSGDIELTDPRDRRLTESFSCSEIGRSMILWRGWTVARLEVSNMSRIRRRYPIRVLTGSAGPAGFSAAIMPRKPLMAIR
jgi:hypothetical protein